MTQNVQSEMVFVAGWLATDACLTVLGQADRAVVRVEGLRLNHGLGDDLPWMERDDAARVDGRLVPFSKDLAALAQVFGLTRKVLITRAGPVTVLTGAPQSATAQQKDWTRRWGAMWDILFVEMLAVLDGYSPEQLRRSLPQIKTRVTSKLRAKENPSDMTWRRGLTGRDVAVVDETLPYLNYFAVLEQDLTFARFDGTRGQTVKRAAFVSGDAVTVLPYDPVRDRVLVIEQFRFGPFVRGDAHPWSLEAVAGRIDPGEDPETAARREAREETGLALHNLELVSRYYPSPGAVSEYLYSYIGITDLPDDSAIVSGVPEEAEDIRGLLLSFDEAMAAFQSGEFENGPLNLTILWLAQHRDRLRNA